MLQLVGIKKDYYVGKRVVPALRGIDLTLGESGLVSILGQSGCGKTTLMNVIGGLDHYTEGDVIIDGVSTKEYKEKDWNTYRNETIGFVFQSYNLIPHTSVLGNVELAMTLSGLDAKTRRKRATEMLEKVGLGNELHKRPNQLSGGQCQRVAIARALVCDPKIILADEPTGAIDSETSVQIMDLLKEISKDKLVVVVTHNAELAEAYSDRIITMRDGLLVKDEDTRFHSKSSFLEYLRREEMTAEEKQEEKTVSAPVKRRKRTSMSFFTATRLSLQNVLHKKGRSILTVFAGSIGIICISLILAMNSGFTQYIERYERESLLQYPVEVKTESDSIFGVIEAIMTGHGSSASIAGLNLTEAIEVLSEKGTSLEKYTDEEKVYLERVLLSALDDMEAFQKKLKTETDISKFYSYAEEHFDPSWGTIRKDYGLDLNIYSKEEDGSYTQISPIADVTIEYGSAIFGGLSQSNQNKIRSLTDTLSEWTMMLDNREVLDSQYDVLAGEWPDYTTEEGRNGLVLVVDEYNRIKDTTLYFLYKLTLAELFTALFTGSTKEIKQEFSFEDFLSTTYTLMIPTDFYTYNERTRTYSYAKSQETIDRYGIDLHISAIVRLKEGRTAGCIGGAIGYTEALADYVIERTNAAQVVSEQRAVYAKYEESLEKVSEIKTRLEKGEITLDDLTTEDQMLVASVTAGLIRNVVTGGTYSVAEYQQFLTDLQVKDFDKPEKVYFYASGIQEKKNIIDMINDFNETIRADETLAGSLIDYSVTYTDELSAITASMQDMINTITYILIAVAVVSVVVAMLLVAIILYISVQDRTKEIGVLRALGASKGNVSNVFIAETFLIGLMSGLIGVLLGFVLSFPGNEIILAKLGIRNLLQPTWWQALCLIGFSMVTTTVSGIIPSYVASKKDPVIALRTE